MQRSTLALSIWDYFFISNVPARGDEKPWSAIERATCRIRDAETLLDPPNPMDVRLQHARRLRNAARAALREIQRLRVEPERWVTAGLAELEMLGDKMIEELAEDARRIVLD